MVLLNLLNEDPYRHDVVVCCWDIGLQSRWHTDERWYDDGTSNISRSHTDGTSNVSGR